MKGTERVSFNESALIRSDLFFVSLVAHKAGLNVCKVQSAVSIAVSKYESGTLDSTRGMKTARSFNVSYPFRPDYKTLCICAYRE